MANFILVHGAWHGAWCWRRVLPDLIRVGHRAHAVTLTGVGERAHLLRADIDLETHVQDVLAAVEAEEMARPILVVHSYAGMLATAIASRQPNLFSHLVYVDAVVPQPGECWSSTHAQATRETRMASAHASPLNTMAPPPAAVYGLSGADEQWVTRRQTPMPAGPYVHALDFDPQIVARVPRTFIDCSTPPLATMDGTRRRVRDPHFWGGVWSAGAQVLSLATGHDAMISAPEALVKILLDVAHHSS